MGAWFLCPSWIYQCVYVILLLLTGHQAGYLACKKHVPLSAEVSLWTLLT